MKERCSWCGTEPIYVEYHDTEWGVPEYDGRALWEKLVLDGFQAGLSWITILKKRENFRRAFDEFDPEKVARFDQARVEALLQDTGIVRHRGKIEATIAGAQAWIAIEEREGFSDFLWNFMDGVPLQNNFTKPDEIPAQTPLSNKMSRALKAEGFRFCGPTITYAFMQATGMVNDHLTTCFRHAELSPPG